METTPKVDKRQAILQASWRLIRHYGYAKTTITDIAREAGIGKGTVYLYFRSKDEIMLALADVTNERITRDLVRIAAGEEPAADRLRKCLLHRVMKIYDLVSRHPHGEDVITPIKPEIVKRVERHVRSQGAILEGILADGTAAGEFTVEHPDQTGQLLADLFELLTPPYYRFRTRKDLEHFASRVVDLMMAGIRSKEKEEEEV